MPEPKRVILFGGSFNPPHCGHLRLALHVMAEGLGDSLWFLLSPKNPLKEESHLWPDDLRMRLTTLLAELADEAWGSRGIFLASDFEIGMPRPSYTADTLAALREKWPEREFLLLMGADSWNSFHLWRRPEEIMAHHQLLVYPREGYPVRMEALPEGVRYLANAPLFPYSSTEVRRRLAEGDDVDELLPGAIREALRKEQSPGGKSTMS